MPGFVAYYRVSTAKQGRSGLGLDAQRAAVRDFLASARPPGTPLHKNLERVPSRGTQPPRPSETSHEIAGGPHTGSRIPADYTPQSILLSEYTETESGKNNARPQLAAALRHAKAHKATLIIAKLDRLARNTAFIANLMEAGVDFVACDNPTATRFTLHILAAVAEHEAKMISERTKAALAAARRRGTKLGGDRGNLPRVAKRGARASVIERRRKSSLRARELEPVIAEAREHFAEAQVPATLQAFADFLNARNWTAPRGGAWGPSQVHTLLQKLEG